MQSGILNFIPTICSSIESGCFNKISKLSIDSLNSQLQQLYDLSNKQLNIEPNGLYYDFIDKNGMVNIMGIMTSNQDLVPIKPVGIRKEVLVENKIIYKISPINYTIDEQLVNYNKNDVGFIDNRIIAVNTKKYKDESYELFKFELSHALNQKSCSKMKENLKNLIDSFNAENSKDNEVEILDKLNEYIRDLAIDSKTISIINEVPNINYYNVKNKRVLCENLSETKCVKNIHCGYSRGKCSLATTNEYLDEFIRRLSNELLEQKIKMFEFIQLNGYFVSDIVDYNNFDEIPGRKVIRTNEQNSKYVFKKLFGNLFKTNENSEEKEITQHFIKDIKTAYVQNIILLNLSIIRAYTNGYYWIKHSMYDIESRNLGYYSDYQTEFINIFRSLIIDWLNDINNLKILAKLSEKEKGLLMNNIVYNTDNDNIFIINNYIVELMEKTTENNFGLFELYILNQIHKVPITISMNDFVSFSIDNGIVKLEHDKIVSDNYLNKDRICVSLSVPNENQYPTSIEIFYYK